MKRLKTRSRQRGVIFLMVMFAFGMVLSGMTARAFAQTPLGITWAVWKADDKVLKMKGTGAGEKNQVFVKDAVTGETIGTVRSEDDGRFEFSREHLEFIPASLLITSNGESVMIGFTEATRKRGGAAVLISLSEWRSSDGVLFTKGTGPSKAEVVFFGVENENKLGSTRTESDGKWEKRFENPSAVPCRIRIETDGAMAETAVNNAPLSCGVVVPPEAPLLTDITVGGPSAVSEKSRTAYTATARYEDGTTQNVTIVCLWQVNDGAYAQMTGSELTTLEVPSDQVVELTATYTENGISRSDTLLVTILDQAVPLEGSHAGRFATYEGTATCLACHNDEAVAVHGSVHYQWKGDASETVGLKPGDAGKLGGINDFCIFPDINWIGKLTNVSGQLVDGGCAKCHVGLGEKPEQTVSRSQLENIDCLVCHSDDYKRTVEKVDGAFRFVPDTAKMSVSILQAASNITLPSNDSCLNCHTKAGGGNNFKRGDLEEAHRNATRAFDVHLAKKANGGAGLKCLDCHTADNHRIAGRGTDLRPYDSLDEVSCEKCHGAFPHDDRRINKHTNRVNCTVCHIPTFAKVAATDMDRDWREPGELNQAKGLYEPFNRKMTDVIPEYRFFNGMSYFYQFGDTAIPEANGFITMSAPMGSITDPGARIYAFKHHLGNQPIDPSSGKLLPLKIGLFFQTGVIDQAVQKGVEAVGWPYQGHEFARTERFMGLFHEVAPADEALSCTECHGTGGRMDFNLLGYTPKQTYNGKPLCASCHEDESDEWNASERFRKIHAKHVDDKRYDCNRCHNFSKAQ